MQTMRWTSKAARWMGAPARRSLRGRQPEEAAEISADPAAFGDQVLPAEQIRANHAREIGRREVGFAAGAPGRAAARRARLAEWAESEDKSPAELAAAYDRRTLMEEAMTRYDMWLQPRSETERELYREWAQLDADVVAEAARVERAESDREAGLFVSGADERTAGPGDRHGRPDGGEPDLEAGF
jgi:hypothetical protein